MKIEDLWRHYESLLPTELLDELALVFVDAAVERLMRQLDAEASDEGMTKPWKS